MIHLKWTLPAVLARLQCRPIPEAESDCSQVSTSSHAPATDLASLRYWTKTELGEEKLPLRGLACSFGSAGCGKLPDRLGVDSYYDTTRLSSPWRRVQLSRSSTPYQKPSMVGRYTPCWFDHRLVHHVRAAADNQQDPFQSEPSKALYHQHPKC